MQPAAEERDLFGCFDGTLLICAVISAFLYGNDGDVEVADHCIHEVIVDGDYSQTSSSNRLMRKVSIHSPA